jgi:hypothetical protein
MIGIDKSQLWAALMMSLAVALPASIPETNNTPYQVIVERNAFGLKPPPPPPAPATNKPPETHNIKFTGISLDAAGKKAYLMSDDPPKPGQQPARHYYCLSEGERQGDIEVREINELAETVTVLNGADLVTLNFKEHGNASSPPPGMPGRPGVVLPGVPPAPGMMATPAVPVYQNGIPTFSPAIPNAQTAAMNLSEAVDSAITPNNTANRSIPTRSLRTQPFGGPPMMQPVPQPQIDPDAQKALMLINSQMNANQNLPPLPPIE